MGGGSSREMVVGGDSVHKILLVCWKDEASLSNISPVYPLENVPWRSAKDKMNWHMGGTDRMDQYWFNLSYIQ